MSSRIHPHIHPHIVLQIPLNPIYVEETDGEVSHFTDDAFTKIKSAIQKKYPYHNLNRMINEQKIWLPIGLTVYPSKIEDKPYIFVSRDFGHQPAAKHIYNLKNILMTFMPPYKNNTMMVPITNSQLESLPTIGKLPSNIFGSIKEYTGSTVKRNNPLKKLARKRKSRKAQRKSRK